MLLLRMKFLILKHLLFGPAGPFAFLAPDLLVSLLFFRLPAHDERFYLIGEYPSGKEAVQRL